jgi:anti-anti-sigma factor
MDQAADSNFKVRIARSDGVCLVRVNGELDLANADGFGDRLMQLSDQTVVVDLSGLTFIDCSGFSAFVRANNLAEGADRQLVLVRPRSNIERLFSSLGLDGLIGQWQSEWASAD